MTVPITHELTIHEELICDLDEMLIKSDAVALKVEQDWTRTIEVYEAQIKFARDEMARLKRRQQSERRGLERQRAKEEFLSFVYKPIKTTRSCNPQHNIRMDKNRAETSWY